MRSAIAWSKAWLLWPILVAQIVLIVMATNSQAGVPKISGVVPLTTAPGTTITISGEGFSTVSEENTVYFGAVKAPVASASSSNLSLRVPAGATYAPITVTVSGLTASAPLPFSPTYWGAGAGISSSSFPVSFNLPVGDGPSTTVVADIDGDGKPDLVVGNGYGFSIRIFRNVGTNAAVSAASFAAPVDFTVPRLGTYTPYKITVVDLDGDGKLDLLVCGTGTDKLALWRNTSVPGSISTNSFTGPVLLTTGSDVRFARAADLDGDGRLDIVSANYGSSTISILRNIGLPGTLAPESFAPRIDFPCGNGPYELAIGDLDGDGRPDIATVNTASSVSLFRNVCTNGVLDTNSFAARVDIPALSNGSSIAIGDLDLDGKLDLVAAFVQPLSISVYRNQAAPGVIDANSFAPAVNFAVGNWVHNVVLADLDGDGRPDVATAGELPSYVSVFRNLSSAGHFDAGSLGTRIDFGAGWNAWGLAIGDLDEDGRPDLVFANTYDDTLTIYANASAYAGPPVVLVQPTNQTVAVGEPATFLVSASGSTDMAYQWWKGSATIDGATNSAYTISSAQFTDEAQYFVVLTNQYGAVTSSVAQLTVTNLPLHHCAAQEPKCPHKRKRAVLGDGRWDQAALLPMAF